MKRSIVGIVFKSLAVGLVLTYLVFSLMAFRVDDRDIKCNDLAITIHGKLQLLTEDEIHGVLNDIQLHPIGSSLNELYTNEIERFLEQNPMVKSARCFHTPDGQASLDLYLREPLFLVSGKENYYVDTEKKIMPVRVSRLAYVPLITGRVTRTMATGELFDFVNFIVKDPFWNAQIAQIHVRNDLKVELVPRVGDAIILLGKLEQYQEKLNKVLRLYTEGFNVMGWDNYSLLDLQYNDQIVATKKNLTNKHHL